MLIYVKSQTDGHTDRQTHQKYSSELHKKIIIWIGLGEKWIDCH